VCVIERNNHGHTVMVVVKDDGAVNLSRREVTESITGQNTQKYGWNTDHKA
jgi:hypothetical protein